LQASNKELARATRYFYDEEPKNETVLIDSKPFFFPKKILKKKHSPTQTIYTYKDS
jgi:hypothetical protein